jgi:hypothetical protein
MKFTIYGALVMLVVGVWFGLNIANDRPLLSNPFAERTMQEKAVGTARDLLEQSEHTLNDALD